MAISTFELRSAAAEAPAALAKSLNEARESGVTTAFLCHSHLDSQLAKGLSNLLRKYGWRVYIDWEDTTMPATPDRETAKKIQTKIVTSDFFLFLATENSVKSRWCPWEIGYADGKKPIDSIVIVPTKDDSGVHGNEYLQLYRHIEWSDTQRIGVWDPGQTKGLLVEALNR